MDRNKYIMINKSTDITLKMLEYSKFEQCHITIFVVAILLTLT